MTDSKIRVQTRDGEILEVDLTIAKQWQPIKNIYEVVGTVDTSEKPFELANVDSDVLQKIIEWATVHKEDELDAEGKPKKSPIVHLTESDKKFFEIKQEILFGIIMGADYLGMNTLLDAACKTVADMIRDKTPEEVRQTFNIPNDLPPDDEDLEPRPVAATTTQ